MTIVKEIYLEDFEPWGGAEALFDRIVEEGKLNALEAILDDLFFERESITDVELNDMLRFEPEEVCHWLGMKTDDEIEEEREERENRRAAIERLAETESEEEFCGIWSSDLDMDCAGCPLYHEKDCESAGAIRRNREGIQAALAELLKELEEEEDE